jgi:exodeoxyribonuclease VII large subunit
MSHPYARIDDVSQPAFDFDAAATPDVEPTYSVGELSAAINDTLRRGFGGGVWVRGEVQGWSDRGPHAYFSLVEHDGDGKAVVHVQFFAPQRARLKPLLARHRLALADGMKVRIFGTLDYYAPSGRLGLKMSNIDPRFTLGELALARTEVIRRLIESGAYDANRGRVMSPVPLRLGVVTSVGSAAWHDFVEEIRRSALGFSIAVADTRVQGDGAARSVAAAIGALGARPDLDAVVVIRGGGARNELAVFDDEELALAIAASPLPVVTGIGHETDRSIADEVAHTALKTPTACAAAFVQAVRAYADGCEAAWRRVERLARHELAGSTAHLTECAHRIARRTQSAVERADGRLISRFERLRSRSLGLLDGAESSLERAAARLGARPGQLLDAETRHLGSLAAQVAALDPATQLARGWSITRTADGRVVRSEADAPTGTVLHTQVAHGAITSRVEEST